MSKDRWRHAIALFAEVVKMVPDSLMFRQCLRACQRKNYKGNKKGATLGFLKRGRIQNRVDTARKANDWAEMDLASEEGLAVNPWDSKFHADLGESARGRGFLEIAVFAYEQATGQDGDPRNKNLLIRLAEVYELQRNHKKAVETLDRVTKLDSPDKNIEFDQDDV